MKRLVVGFLVFGATWIAVVWLARIAGWSDLLAGGLAVIAAGRAEEWATSQNVSCTNN